MTYDNVKSHKNRVFIVSLEDTIFAKSQGEEGKGQGRGVGGSSRGGNALWLMSNFVARHIYQKPKK